MFKVVLAFGLFALLGAAASPAGADQVTAEFTPTSGANSYGSFGLEASVVARGQIFDATVSGRLVSIMLRCARIGDHAVPLRISVFATDGASLPTGEALASELFAPELLPVDGGGEEITFAFSSTEAGLLAGQRYAISAEPATPSDEASLHFMVGAANAGAVYGPDSLLRFSSGSWSRSDATDYVFRVMVDESVAAEARTWGGVKRLAN